MLESLFDKVLALKVKTDDPIQIFSCEYCEIMKNSFFYTTLVAASESCFFLHNLYKLVFTRKVQDTLGQILSKDFGKCSRITLSLNT